MFAIIFVILQLFFCNVFGNALGNKYDNEIIVNLSGVGKVQGSITKSAWTEQTIYQFLAIPYAESPTGQRRFKPPVPRLPWQGIKNATVDGRECPSPYGNYSNIESSEGDIEDCLHLSVYTKNFSTKSPVMLFIHGGAFVVGSSREHPSNYLLEKDIVLVVPQYRLGAFGFLSTRSEEIPGNAAALDILLALEWVQANIEKFGGDPKQITIFGQSAGTAFAGLLSISPFVRQGLFTKFILQSGSILSAWAVEYEPLNFAQKICRKSECTLCEQIDDINDCLMKIPTQKLLEVSRNERFLFAFQDFYNIIPNELNDLIKNNTRKYKFMAGVTKHDGSFVLEAFYGEYLKDSIDLRNITINSRELIDVFVKETLENDKNGLITSLLMRLLFTEQQLNSGNFTEIIPGLIDLLGIIMMKSPVLRFVQLTNDVNPANSYLYSFDYKGEQTRFGYGRPIDHLPFTGGVHHTDDNLYLFPTVKLNEKDTQMAKKMVELWTSFAISGIPQLKGAEPWPLFHDTSGPFYHIDSNPSVGKDFLDEFLATVNDPTNNLVKEIP